MEPCPSCGHESRAGHTLHYVEHGSEGSPPLLCLHGITLAGGAWDTFAARMCDRYHVLAPTARGHGDSDRADNYLGTVLVDDTAAFLEATGSAPATVCGHSMGGAIGIALAAIHPDKVKKLIVVDSGPTPGGFRETLTDWLNSAPDSFDTVDEAVEQWKRMPGVGMDKVDVKELRRNIGLVTAGTSSASTPDRIVAFPRLRNPPVLLIFVAGRPCLTIETINRSASSSDAMMTTNFSFFNAAVVAHPFPIHPPWPRGRERASPGLTAPRPSGSRSSVRGGRRPRAETLTWPPAVRPKMRNPFGHSESAAIR